MGDNLLHVAGEDLKIGDHFSINPADGLAYRFGEGWPLAGVVPRDVAQGESFKQGGWVRYNEVDSVTIELMNEPPVMIFTFFQEKNPIYAVGFSLDHARTFAQSILDRFPRESAEA